MAFELVPVDTGVSLDTIGWIAGGVGVAALAAGAGVLVSAGGIKDDLDALNADPQALGAVTYEAYRAQYAADESDFETQRTAGYVLIGVGTAAVIAGVTLLLYPEDEDGDAVEPTPAGARPPSATAPGFVPLPGAGAVVGGFRF